MHFNNFQGDSETWQVFFCWYFKAHLVFYEISSCQKVSYCAWDSRQEKYMPIYSLKNQWQDCQRVYFCYWRHLSIYIFHYLFINSFVDIYFFVSSFIYLFIFRTSIHWNPKLKSLRLQGFQTSLLMLRKS